MAMTQKWEFCPNCAEDGNDLLTFGNLGADIIISGMTAEAGNVCAEALNVWGDTGMTPNQMLERIKSLEETMETLIFVQDNDDL